MDRWSAATLDGQGVPVLDVKGREERLFSENTVRLYDGDEKTEFDNGIVYLTTHQIIWVEADPSQPRRAISLPLSYILEYKSTAGVKNWLGTFSSPKIILRLHARSDAHRSGGVAKTGSCKLSFRREDSAKEVEYFETQLKSATKAKGWDSTAAAAVEMVGGGGGGGSGYVGIKGQMALAEKRRQAAAATIENAFDGNLKGLMSEARNLVGLAERCTAKISKGEASATEVDEFRAYLLSMGIADPVTRSKAGGAGGSSSGSAFHSELARELGAFLTKPYTRRDGSASEKGLLADGNGMVALHEVYCLYNKARGGIELISPRDLVEACAEFHLLGIPMVLHEFKSKVIAIRDSSLNDNALAEQVGAFVSEHGVTSPSQLAQAQGISVTLAREQLLTAESFGKLCRDDTIDCMRFYPNLFLRPEISC
eukprot:gene19992-20934_t